MADKLVLTAELVGKFETELKRVQRELRVHDAETAKWAAALRKSGKATTETTEGIKKFHAGSTQLRRELKALGEGLGKLSPEFGKVASEAGALTIGAGAVVGVITALGAATAVTAQRLGEFGRSMQSLRYASQQSGFSVTQMRQLEQVGSRFNIQADEVRQGAVNFGWSMTKIATGFENFRSQLQQTGFGRIADTLFNRLQKNANDTTGALQDVLEEYDRIRKQAPGQLGEQTINKLNQLLGLPANFARMTAKEFADELEHVRSIDQSMGLTPEKWAQIVTEGEQFHHDIADTEQIFSNFGALIAHDVEPAFHKLVGDFNSLFASRAQDWAKTFGDTVATDLRDLEGIVKLFDWIEAHTPEWLKAVLRGRVGELATSGGGGPMVDVPGVGPVPSTVPGAGGGGPPTFRPGIGPGRKAAAAPAGGGGGAAGGPGPPIATGAETAVGGGPPSAFIMHHTGGGGDVAGVMSTLKQRGLGVEYVMDRQGNVYHTGGPGSANILPGWGPKGQGLSNKNIVGMEVIAKDDRDVTAAQVKAASDFIAKNYPNTPVFGHGEVNPGHKEATEGMRIVSAIRAERSRTGRALAEIGPMFGGFGWGDPTLLTNARQAIDSANQKKIEGTGKIDVTVGAAKEGKRNSHRNILRSVPLQRHRQQEPAATGPAEPVNNAATFSERFQGGN